MCIFVHEVKVVRNTRILVGPTSKGRQVTIYENYVGVEGGYRTTGSRHGPGTEMKGAKDEKAELARIERKKLENANAMILPCPHDEDSKDIMLLDLSKDGFRFDDLKGCFPYGVMVTKGKGSEEGVRCAKSVKKLEVVEVGAYNVSVARNLEDLKRVDGSVFSMPPNVDQLLSKLYGKGFAFVICAFDGSKKLDPHPIGYVHDRPATNRLFVPCVHEHGHESKDGKEDFDHTIYSLCTNQQTMGGSTPEETHTQLKAKKWSYIQEAKSTPAGVLQRSKVLFPLLSASLLSLRRLELHGRFANEDLIMSLDQSYTDNNAPLLASVQKKVVEDEEDPYDVRKNLPTSKDMTKNLEEWQTLYTVLRERLNEVGALPVDDGEEE